MDIDTELLIVSADRFSAALLITFSDDRCGLYSAALLRDMLPQATEVFPEDDVEHGDALPDRC